MIMKARPTLPRGYGTPSGILGEKDAEVGRRIEKGQPVDPAVQAKKQAQQEKKDQEWKMQVEEMERKDSELAEKDIVKLKKFLEEVAREERKRQEEMRERVEKITEVKLTGKDEGLKTKDGDSEIGPLVEPSTKKRRSFVQKLRKKGKGAMAEARGAIAKGGG